MLIVPATANILGKAAHGIADDLLSATILGCPRPIIFAPAMNPVMWEKPAVQRNLETLRQDGHVVLRPSEGISVTTGRLDVGLVPSLDRVVAQCWSWRVQQSDAEDQAGTAAVGPRVPTADGSTPPRSSHNDDARDGGSR